MHEDLLLGIGSVVSGTVGVMLWLMILCFAFSILVYLIFVANGELP